MKIGDFFIALGFQVDNAKLKEFNDQMSKTLTGFAKIGAGAAAGVYAINRFLSSSVQSSVALKNFRDQTGYATEDIERFYNVAGRLNTEIDLGQTIGMFNALRDTISEATEGGGAIGAAARLGLSDISRMTPTQVINALRENFDKNVTEWGRGRTIDLMEELGVGREFIQSIEAAPELFDKLWNKAIPTPQQRQAMERMAQVYADFGFEYDRFKFRMSERIAPPFQDFIMWMSQTGLPIIEEFTVNMGHIGSALHDAFSGLDAEWQNGFLGIMGVLAAGLAPVTATIVGLTVALNDLGKALGGGESYFGKGMLWLLNLMDSEEGSTIATMKKILENQGNGQAKNIYRGSQPERSPVDWADRYSPTTRSSVFLDPSQNNRSIINHNTMQVETTADAEETARLVIEGFNQMQWMSEQDNIMRGSIPELR